MKTVKTSFPTHPNRRVFAFTAIAMAMQAPLSYAQEADTAAQPDDKDIEVITVGTRAPDRTATDSPVAVDIFGAEEIQAQGSTDMNNILGNLIPSFNVTAQPIGDGSSFVRPVTLRGMAPDHTLVLVNGKRHHRSALVHLTPGSGAQGRGTQGPDVSNIPALALSNISVLRDGAAAQYGSDAIAGVVDFSLRRNSEGVEVVTQYGQFYEGESEYKVSTNVGLPLGDDGFLNFTAEITSQEELSRGRQHNAAAAIIAAAPELADAVGDPAQIWGRPDADSARLFWNAGIASGEGEIYFFGNYAEMESTGSFFYRPISGVAPGIGRNGVFSNGDVNVCVQFCDLFPGGFTPRFSGEVTDYSQVVGYKGDFGEVGYDFSYSFGSNKIDYSIANTVNPALGERGVDGLETQTAFDTGALEQQDTNINLDFTYPLTDEIFLAAGLEWREEAYIITAGETASWNADPELAAQGFAVGSNGFGGYHPDVAGEFDRENIAVYLDAEWELSADLLLTGAVRYEDFTDFGSTTNVKVASRYNLTDSVVLRAAASTGFKAPTVGQQVTSSVSTQFVTNEATGEIEQSQVATLPVEHPVSLIMGAQPLDAEESTNYSLGTTITLEDVTIALDFYQIEVEDRIGLTSQNSPTEAQQAQIDALNLDQNFARVAYFTNAFDTETRGADLVVSYDISDRTKLALGYAFTETEVTDADVRVVNRERQVELEEGLPNQKGNLTLTHKQDDWSVMARINYFGEVTDAGGTPEADELNGAEFTLDAEFSYQINDNFTVSVGAANLLDEYPDETSRTSGPVTTGLPYFRQSPVGYNGGMWYARLNAKF